jgi:hypothetical protein
MAGMVRRAAWCLFAAACGSSVPAAPAAPAGAGAPPGAPLAWRSFESRDSGFVVSVPGPIAIGSCTGKDCRDFRVVLDPRTGFFVHTWLWGGAPAPEPERVFDAMRDAWMTATKEVLASERSTTMAGLPCRAFEASGARNARIQGRIVFDARTQRVYELSVETERDDGRQEGAATFFDSFHVSEAP